MYWYYYESYFSGVQYFIRKKVYVQFYGEEKIQEPAGWVLIAAAE